jgi:hypothetical protein
VIDNRKDITMYNAIPDFLHAASPTKRQQLSPQSPLFRFGEGNGSITGCFLLCTHKILIAQPLSTVKEKPDTLKQANIEFLVFESLPRQACQADSLFVLDKAKMD